MTFVSSPADLTSIVILSPGPLNLHWNGSFHAFGKSDNCNSEISLSNIFRITPIDCFFEGAKPLGPSPPIDTSEMVCLLLTCVLF
jgi:hypothetical protein